MSQQAQVDSAVKKAALLQAISQLDMLVQMFADAPDDVKKSATEFRDSLKRWSKNA